MHPVGDAIALELDRRGLVREAIDVVWVICL